MQIQKLPLNLSLFQAPPTAAPADDLHLPTDTYLPSLPEFTPIGKSPLYFKEPKKPDAITILGMPSQTTPGAVYAPPAKIEIYKSGDSTVVETETGGVRLFERSTKESHTGGVRQQDGKGQVGPGFEYKRTTTVRNLESGFRPDRDSEFVVKGLTGMRSDTGKNSSRAGTSHSGETFQGAEIQANQKDTYHLRGVDVTSETELRAAAGRTAAGSVEIKTDDEQFALGGNVKVEMGGSVSAKKTVGVQTGNGSGIQVGAGVSGGVQEGFDVGGAVGRDNKKGETTVGFHGGIKLLGGVDVDLQVTVNDKDIEAAARSTGGEVAERVGGLLGGREGARQGRKLGEQLGKEVADAATGALDKIPRFAKLLSTLSHDAQAGLQNTISFLH